MWIGGLLLLLIVLYCCGMSNYEKRESIRKVKEFYDE